MTGWRDDLVGEARQDVAELDAALGLALHHRAYVEALLDPRGRLFQRLEYVGDSILDAVVLQSLVLLQPWDERSLELLSDEQQALVSDHALGAAAGRRGLPPVRTFQASVHRLADRIEAAVGAAWADSGLAAAEAVATALVVEPGLRRHARRGGPPRAAGDARYESAARACGHEPVERAWFGAAAEGGSPRRRLAMVGTAVLEAATSMAQYVADAEATEAEMSAARRGSTSNAVLAARARELGLAHAHEDQDERSVADEAQALVGAAAMDGGTVAGLTVACAVLRLPLAPGPLPAPADR